jgi:hypothetical protein
MLSIIGFDGKLAHRLQRLRRIKNAVRAGMLAGQNSKQKDTY